MTETLKNMNVFRKRVDNSFLRKISMPDLANMTETSDQTDVSKESFKMPEPKSAGLPMVICKQYIEMVKNGAKMNESQKSEKRSIKPKISTPSKNKTKKDVLQNKKTLLPTSTPMKIPVKRNTMLLSPVMSPISKDVSENKEINKKPERRSLRNAETNTTPHMGEENMQNKENKAITNPKIKVLSDYKFTNPTRSKNSHEKNSVDTKSENHPKTSSNVATKIVDDLKDDVEDQESLMTSRTRPDKIMKLTNIIKGKNESKTKLPTSKAGKKDMRSENGRKKTQSNDKKSATFPKPYNPPIPPILDYFNLEENKSKDLTKDELSKHHSSITKSKTSKSGTNIEKNTKNLINIEETSICRVHVTRNKLESKSKQKYEYENEEVSSHGSKLEDIPDMCFSTNVENISETTNLINKNDINSISQTPESVKMKKTAGTFSGNKNQYLPQENTARGKVKNNKTVRDLSEVFESLAKEKSIVNDEQKNDNIGAKTRSRSKENKSIKKQDIVKLDDNKKSEGVKTRNKSKENLSQKNQDILESDNVDESGEIVEYQIQLNESYSLRNQQKIEINNIQESDNHAVKTQSNKSNENSFFKDKLVLGANQEIDDPEPILPKKRGRKKKVVTEEIKVTKSTITSPELYEHKNEKKPVGRPKKKEKASPKKRGRKKKLSDIPTSIIEKKLEKISPKKVTKAIRQARKSKISPVKVKRLSAGSTFSYTQFRKLFPEATKTNASEPTSSGRPKRIQKQRKADVVIIMDTVEKPQSKSRKKQKISIVPNKKTTKKNHLEKQQQIDSDRNTDICDSGIFDNQNEPSTSVIIQTKTQPNTEAVVLATKSDEIVSAVEVPENENVENEVNNVVEILNKIDDIVIESNAGAMDNKDTMDSSNTEGNGIDTPNSQSSNFGDNEIPSNEKGILLDRLFSRKRKNVSFANSFTTKKVVALKSTDTVNTIYFPTENGNADFITWFVEEPKDEKFDYIPGSNNTIAMAKTLKAKNNSWGIIKILPGGNKNGSILKSISMSYIILKGKAEVSVHNRTKVANKLDRFFIPKGAEYSIRNLCSKDILLMEYCKFIE